MVPYLEKVDQSNDSCSVTVTELNGVLKQTLCCVNCEEDDVSSWLDCDADDAGFQQMSDVKIIVKDDEEVDLLGSYVPSIRPFWDGHRNFKQRSDDEDDTCYRHPPLQTSAPC
ncbi:hypothetical protein AVEN_140978-1 [Araneus ventricosus]|uniref:Uncharacterized protein n=1 Tax=Araneus ventricosus TaxID=182803 RepID=A0A4Y2PL13_ARAVE|nr:hypothetical protein AVEN_140978-1 [Araneus ventricosus]